MSNTKKILIVEDNELNGTLLYDWLKSNHYDVILVERGEKAIEVFNQQKPDIALIDIHLDCMVTGVDIMLAIKASEHKVPTIAITAYNFIDRGHELIRIGFDEFIEKPLRIEVLLKTVQKYLDKN